MSWTVSDSKSNPCDVDTGSDNVNFAAVLSHVVLCAQSGTHVFQVSTPVAVA